MLSSLYAYGDIAYIGGVLVGIHNTLEAAAFGLPVIFGPNYLKI
jgi:3-deoxy-D-manno-octulosonic-acid transferase